jgi:hypothetical protein
MWYLWLIVLLLYVSLSWYSLIQASSPRVKCDATSECFHPLVSSGERLVMEMWLYQPSSTSNDTSIISDAYYKWMPVDSCRFNFTVPTSGVIPIDVTGNSTACLVPLPDFARQRFPNPNSAKPLQASFRFLNLNGVLVTDVRFHLTRFIERKGNDGWSINNSPTTPARNLLEAPVPASTQKMPDGPQWIPYLKYGRAAVRLRFVSEYRPYGALVREDGVDLQRYNKTMYRPMIYVDDNSLPQSAKFELAPPEDSKPPITLRIKLSALSPIMDSLNHQVTLALQAAESFFPGNELDEIRYFIADERLYRFLCTQVISYLHMWFDYMAFQGEIQFYRGKQSLAGVSASSVISRFICSFIILLYLLDGGGTSWVIILSLVSSCAVEGWKVWKLLRPTLKRSFPFIAVRQLESTVERDTAEYDRIAATNLAMILYPMVVGWSFYALHHYVYTSWYSWLISNLANAVYTFGFIALCPQLYVNYRLKSVTHLPWKVFMYKIFNTFVDDAFAWLIEMPWKHRIMTLRDDVVFLMLLVQVYMYRVDKSRTNEFGYSYESSSPEGEQGEKSKEKQH